MGDAAQAIPVFAMITPRPSVFDNAGVISDEAAGCRKGLSIILINGCFVRSLVVMGSMSLFVTKFLIPSILFNLLIKYPQDLHSLDWTSCCQSDSPRSRDCGKQDLD